MNSIKAVETLSGSVSAESTLVGSISCNGGLTGNMPCGGELTGKMSVVVITKVPYWETSNSSNGTTAYIAKGV